MSDRSPRMVRTIDREAALPLIRAAYEAIYGEPMSEKASVDRQVVTLAWNPDAWGIGAIDVAIIGTEGVGEFSSEYLTLPVRVTEPRGHSFEVPLGVNRIPLADEPVDFAEHVRTFGSRLESNWSLWDRRIGEALKRRAKGERPVCSANAADRLSA